MYLGTSLKEVSKNENGVHLILFQRNGALKDLHVEHIIAATGYKVKLQSINFLDEGLRRQMKTVDDSPILNTNFESPVPGLYYVGLAAAPSFGPLYRFAYGAKFTASRLDRHVARTT